MKGEKEVNDCFSNILGSTWKVTISSTYCKPDCLSLLEVVYLGLHNRDNTSIQLHTTQTRQFFNWIVEKVCLFLSCICKLSILYLFLTMVIEGDGNHDVSKGGTGTNFDEIWKADHLFRLQFCLVKYIFSFQSW